MGKITDNAPSIEGTSTTYRNVQFGEKTEFL